jgi:hypothetical protein
MRVLPVFAVVLLMCSVNIVPVAGIIPAIQKVIQMLENLVTTLTEEGINDEKKWAHYEKWNFKSQEETEVKISDLQTQIEDTKAILGQLYATRGELTTEVNRLSSEVATTQNQITTATDKRNEEHSSYVIEQNNFNNAIAACSKAVEILSQHYGDGEQEELSKPGFMSLLNTYLATIRQAAKGLDIKAHRKGHKLLKTTRPQKLSFLQALGPNDRFQEKTGEALSIVDQVKILASTFSEDQQASMEDEARLQKLYNDLMAEKTQVLADLQAELAQKTKELNQCKQDIASNESKLAMYEKNLADEQAYLANLKEQHQIFGDAFRARKKDREDETAAVNQALGVLDKYNTFLQVHSNTEGKNKGPGCKQCSKAVSFLKSKARLFHSSLLDAAAMASMSSSALDEIISNLEGLITRIDEEQKFETEHKEWCEKETGLTTKKRDDHRYICDDLKAILANLGEVVEEKKTDLGINEGDQNDEEVTWDERDKLRVEEKDEYQHDLADHIEAINALNEAIDILAKYYASRDAKGASFAQLGNGMNAKAFAALFGPGGKVVGMLSETRHEFEVGKETLEKEEVEAVHEYTTDKSIHRKTESDLDHQEDTLTIEKQTTEEQIDQGKEDLTSNTDEVKSAENYLDRLGKSCYPLIARYDKRKELRAEEKQAIKDAIKVLREEA